VDDVELRVSLLSGVQIALETRAWAFLDSAFSDWFLRAFLPSGVQISLGMRA